MKKILFAVIAGVAVGMPSRGIGKADYVPEPVPVETDYDIAALYYPGWSRVQAWERIWKVCPERKPLLGWYDEANPEVVDWQIKWLVENGIRTLYVDWYWNRGTIHHEHWIAAFRKARYRKHLKWAMMWANHNPPGSHSEANMDRDVPDGGCKRLLEISREVACEAGLPGIYFIAMKWGENDCSPGTIRKYKDMGFDMSGIYHFRDSAERAKDSKRYSYKSVADANPANWWQQHKANVLPFLPNLSTGWDDRPWKNEREIYGKNVADLRRICVEAKKFADAWCG